MEDDYFRVPTWTEVCREYAANVGGERPEQAWILTPWDTWERNPAYSGVFADARAELMTFHNPLQNNEFTQTVYLARTPAGG